MSDRVSEFLAKGNQLCDNQQFVEAIAIFQQGINEAPDNKELLYNQAKAYFKVKKLQEAKSNFDKLLASDPSNSELLSERGVILHHIGDNKASLVDLDKAADLDSDNPFRFSSRAWIKAKDGDVEGAIKDYERAIELDPEDSISYNNKGLLEEQLGYKQKAKQSFEQSNKIEGYDPKFKDSPNVEPTEKKKIEITTPDIQAPEQPKLTLKHILNTTKELFSSSEERNSFWKFLLRKK
ncbi:MAG: tetratricopeptide repeat protein [bacterium]|nr:tetratricopeptide repeat protein [bacterium]